MSGFRWMSIRSLCCDQAGFKKQVVKNDHPVVFFFPKKWRQQTHFSLLSDIFHPFPKQDEIAKPKELHDSHNKNSAHKDRGARHMADSFISGISIGRLFIGRLFCRDIRVQQSGRNHSAPSDKWRCPIHFFPGNPL
jgi:hypothetical protein